MSLEHLLREIQSDYANLFHGRPLEWSATPPLWHNDAVGGVHPINLAAHKVEGVRKAIEACGATLLHLPPYSPDLNPIENAFAKLKLVEGAQTRRRLDGHALLPKLILGVKFTNGLEVIAKANDHQTVTAAA